MQVWKPVLIAVAGGLTLGMIGAKAADPVMVQHEQGTWGDDIKPRPVQHFADGGFEAGPQDSNPHGTRYSYAPQLPDSEGRDWRNPHMDRILAGERLHARQAAEQAMADVDYAAPYMQDGWADPSPAQVELAAADPQPVEETVGNARIIHVADAAKRAEQVARTAQLAASVTAPSPAADQPTEPLQAEGELPAVY